MTTNGFFGRNVNNRFTVRRGRLALQYNDDIVKAKFQFNINEEGFHLNDAYLKLTEPWIKSFSLTIGIFPRPFGFETGQSCGDRESPERSRVIQHLYPNTRDLGVMLSYAVPEEKKARGLQVNLGLFNGNSGNAETDRFKDLVGQIRYDRSFKDGKYEFGIGYSTHWGAVNHVYDVGSTNPFDNKYIYELGFLPDGTEAFIADTARSIAAGFTGKRVNRLYYGGDLQFSAKSKMGKTTIRAEYYYGTQISQEPNISQKNAYNFNTYSPGGLTLGVAWPFFDAPSIYNPIPVRKYDRPANTLIRQFSGYYVTLVQQVANTGLELIFRYDWYDPNVYIGRENVKLFTGNGEETRLSPADIKYQTYGVGASYSFNKHIKALFYYDIVRNENTSLPEISFDPGLLLDGIYPSTGYLKDTPDAVSYTHLTLPTKA
jgi:hypothetical protein